MSGGGGSTGKVSFPAHMEEIHQDWLGYTTSPTAITTDMISVMESALATNPLDSLSYTDPATDIGEVETEFGEFETIVDALDAETDFSNIVDQAVSKVDATNVMNDLVVDNIVNKVKSGTATSITEAVAGALEAIDDEIMLKAIEQFVRMREFDRERNRTRYKAQMSNINAERSSAYALGLALMEIDFERQTTEFQTNLELQTYQQGLQVYVEMFAREISARIQMETLNKQSRDKFVIDSVNLMLRHKQFVHELQKALTQIITEIKRIGFVIDSEYTANTADLNWKHASWDMNVYKNGVTVLGGIGGSQFVPDGPTKASSAIGGALSGAGTGAAIGSAVPGIGTAVGAGVGAVLGLSAGLFG